MTLTRRARAAWAIVGTFVVGLAGPALAHRAQQPAPATRATATASISGTVRAASGGAPVARAGVGAVSSALPHPRVALSGGDGRYEFPSLPAGTYTLTVSHTGYVTWATAASGIPLADGQQLTGVDVA